MSVRIQPKYGEAKKNIIRKKPERHLIQKLSYVILDLICSYLVSENRNIKMKGYKNIKELFSVIDFEDYKNDSDIERIDFIRFALDARIVYGIIDAAKVWDYIKTKDTVHAGQYNINIQEMSNKDVDYVNTMVTSYLDSATFSSYIHRLADLSREFDNATAYNQAEIIEAWKNDIRSCNNHIRNSEITDSEREFVSLRPGIFEDYARDTYAYVSNPSSKLSTGMYGMNCLLGGGFESGRVYGFFGLQGEGKSLTLLNMASQIKLYNKKFKTKDPTKTPCIVYLTLENTKRESFTRLFSMTTGCRINEVESVDKGIEMMREKGLVVNDENPVDIIIKYEPSNSIDTGYLYDFADTLAESGYEVICYIIDYINVIRSIDTYRASEERLRLGAIINEFKTIASDMDIPIITAGQLNRDANKRVDEAREKGQYNLAKFTDRSNLGESMLILNNLDGAFIITPVRIESTAEKYLSIKLVKHRFEPYTKPLEYKFGIYQPYENIESINLMCDIGQKPLFLLDLTDKSTEHKVNAYQVDDSVEIPNNDNREPLIEARVSAKNPVLKSDGTTLPYDVDWRILPKYINGKNGDKNVNVNAWCPEKRLRMQKKEVFKNIMSSNVNSLNGISRYSDEYTRIYDPTGSKEERISHDYSIKYGIDFSPNDFQMLYSHFMMMKNGEMPDTDNFVEPTKTYVPEDDCSSNGLFVRVPSIDMEAYMKYLKKINNMVVA